MDMTEEGLALIRRWEGFRAESYRDPTGIWTIGYGHTSAAGEPDVHAGLRLTKEEAEVILRRDVMRFAEELKPLIKRPLTDAQFSALVSFAYNVGLGAVRRSSVLKAVNAGDFSAVPARLALWVKAGGRELPGLVKRRAAEAVLFMATAAQDNSVTTDTGQSKAPGKSLLVTLAAGLAAALGLNWNSGGVAITVLVILALTVLGWGLVKMRRSKARNNCTETGEAE